MITLRQSAKNLMYYLEDTDTPATSLAATLLTDSANQHSWFVSWTEDGRQFVSLGPLLTMLYKYCSNMLLKASKTFHRHQTVHKPAETTRGKTGDKLAPISKFRNRVCHTERSRNLLVEEHFRLSFKLTLISSLNSYLSGSLVK